MRPTSAMKKADPNPCLPAGGDFFERVFEVARKIPYGKVTSYGAIARHLGSGLSARTVGWAMNKSFTASKPVPAHRVVNRNGILTGKHYFGSPTLMQQLLENEGLTIIDDCIQNFEKVFWNPYNELNNSLKLKRR